MKFSTIKYLLIASLSLILFSCSKQEQSDFIPAGEGLLSVDFGYDLDPISITKAEDPIFAINIKHDKMRTIKN